MPTTCLVIFFVLLNTCLCQELLKNDMIEFTTSRNFSGKVVLITESSAGVGRVIAALFSRLGAQLVVVGKDGNVVRQTSKDLQELSPFRLKALGMVADVTKPKDAKNLILETVNKFGKIDVLVNYMGTGDWAGIKHRNFMTVYDQVMKKHLRAVMYLTQQAVPYLIKSNGTIINFSSILSLNPRTFTLAYSSAKAGIDIMTKVLAMELGPRVRVNAINVGLFKMGLPQDELINFIKARAKIDTPLQRLGEPFDIAKAVVFLASSDASFITGANLRIDGGYLFNMI